MSSKESVSRFVFAPMHLTKKGEIKASLFSHAFSKGCSVQRENIANDAELTSFASAFLDCGPHFVWHGVVTADVAILRSAMLADSQDRAFAIYDSAEPKNPAHGEICAGKYPIEEADELEMKKAIFDAFGGGVVTKPAAYRNGAVFDKLPENFRQRQ